MPLAWTEKKITHNLILIFCNKSVFANQGKFKYKNLGDNNV